MEEKKYTQQEMDHAKRFFKLKAERDLLIRIVEQKIDIKLMEDTFI